MKRGEKEPAPTYALSVAFCAEAVGHCWEYHYLRREEAYGASREHDLRICRHCGAQQKRGWLPAEPPGGGA